MISYGIFLFLALLSMIISKSMLLQMALFHSFFLLLSSILCVCVCVCVSHLYSSVNEHLGCFLILAIVYSAFMYIRVHICPGVELLDLMVTLFLVF